MRQDEVDSPAPWTRGRRRTWARSPCCASARGEKSRIPSPRRAWRLSISAGRSPQRRSRRRSRNSKRSAGNWPARPSGIRWSPGSSWRADPKKPEARWRIRCRQPKTALPQGSRLW